MGIKSLGEVNKAKYLGMTWMILALGAAACIGLVSIAYFAHITHDPQLIFIRMVNALFHPLVAGFVLCGVIAANMSTMDSQILVCASVVSEDLVKVFSKRKRTSEELLRISRWGVLVIGLFALLVAIIEKGHTIQNAVMYSWGGLGCTFAPLVLMSLYSTRINRYGAIAGLFVGGLWAVLWPSVKPLVTSAEIASTVIGFPLGLVVIYVVSLLTRSWSPVHQQN
jgi:sodium/proline symporter